MLDHLKDQNVFRPFLQNKLELCFLTLLFSAVEPNNKIARQAKILAGKLAKRSSQICFQKFISRMPFWGPRGKPLAFNSTTLIVETLCQSESSLCIPVLS